MIDACFLPKAFPPPKTLSIRVILRLEVIIQLILIMAVAMTVTVTEVCAMVIMSSATTSKVVRPVQVAFFAITIHVAVHFTVPSAIAIPFAVVISFVAKPLRIVVVVAIAIAILVFIVVIAGVSIFVSLSAVITAAAAFVLAVTLSGEIVRVFMNSTLTRPLIPVLVSPEMTFLGKAKIFDHPHQSWIFGLNLMERMQPSAKSVGRSVQRRIHLPVGPLHGMSLFIFIVRFDNVAGNADRLQRMVLLCEHRPLHVLATVGVLVLDVATLNGARMDSLVQLIVCGKQNEGVCYISGSLMSRFRTCRHE